VTELDEALSSYLASLELGERIQSTRELAKLFDASLGSISTRINFLEEIGAVRIQKRGRLGSFLEHKSAVKLWNIIENSPLVISLTLPSFLKCEGLATAIYSLLNDAGIEAYLIFIRGSLNRLKALRNGHCHATVISLLAAEELCSEEQEIVLRLAPQSFVTDHRVYFRRQSKKLVGPLTVGIDYESFDIKYITEVEFENEDVILQPTPFVQFDLHLEASAVDAAVSNIDHIERLISDEISSRPLSTKTQALIKDRDTSAAFVTRAGANLVKAVLQEVLIPEQVLEIQKNVVNRLLVPRY
jgi:hypothetical protein